MVQTRAQERGAPLKKEGESHGRVYRTAPGTGAAARAWHDNPDVPAWSLSLIHWQ
jgi:hypothetical protein